MQIREHAQATPDKPAAILYPSGITVSFGEMEARANQLAHLFRQAGLREGDVVAILLENNEHYHTVMWAARRAGLYYVPINTHLTAAEAAYIIDNSAAKAIIGSAVFGPVLERLGENLPNGLPELRLVVGGQMDGWRSYPECVADQPDTPLADEIEGDLLQFGFVAKATNNTYTIVEIICDMRQLLMRVSRSYSAPRYLAVSKPWTTISVPPTIVSISHTE